jgi:hypothetical protein
MIEIDREDALALNAVYERALKVLAEAEQVFSHLPKTPERRAYMIGYAEVIADVLSKLRAPLVVQHPDLNAAPSDGVSD